VLLSTASYVIGHLWVMLKGCGGIISQCYSVLPPPLASYVIGHLWIMLKD
jgi:hypothetical protein